MCGHGVALIWVVKTRRRSFSCYFDVPVACDAACFLAEDREECCPFNEVHNIGNTYSTFSEYMSMRGIVQD